MSIKNELQMKGS